MLHYLPDSSRNLPSTLLEKSELERLLAESIDAIPEIERKVLSLYYNGELTLREIALDVHLHESRISQLKSQPFRGLRTICRALASRARCDDPISGTSLTLFNRSPIMEVSL